MLWSEAAKEAELRLHLGECMTDEQAIRRLVLWQQWAEPDETAHIFLADRKGFFLKRFCIYGNGVRMRESYVCYLKSEISNLEAAYFFAVHNHADKNTDPSPDDILLTAAIESLTKWLLSGNTEFLGHYITNGFKVIKIDSVLG